MKHLFIILAFAMTMLSTSVMGGNVKYRVDIDNGKDSTTVVSGMVSDSIDEEDSDSMDNAQPLPASTWYESHDGWNGGFDNAIPIVAIISVFGLPAFVIAIFLWFRYKNNQAKYKLAAQALNSGQEIPNELFKEPTKDVQVFNKGVKNAFLGIGLGVFLWLLTDEEGLAAIGFLIFCMGLAQIVIGYSSRNRDNKVSQDKPSNIMDIIEAKDKKEE